MDRIKDHPQISHNAEKMIGEFPTKECKFSLFNRDNNLDLIDKDIQVFRGLLLEDNTIEYIPQGIFHVNYDDVKTNSTAKTIELTIKDKSIDFDCVYGGIDKISYPCTLGQFVNEIVTRHGLILETPNFPFSDLVLNERPNFDLNTATERYLISSAGEIGGCTVQMSRTGGVRISKPYVTGKIIKKIDYKKLPSKEKQFGPINQVSLSRNSADNDSIISKDGDSIIKNGLCEWEIKDNPYVDLIREKIVDQIASKIFGMTIIPFELEDVIDSYLYDINDSVSIVDKMNNTFNTTILSISSSSRIFTKLRTSVQIKTETNAKLAGSSKEVLKRVALDVEHNNQRINAVVNEQSNQASKISQLEINNTSIVEQVSSINNTVDVIDGQVSQIENTVQETITSNNAQFEVINKTLTDGVEKLKNSLVNIDMDGISVSTNIDNFKALLSNKAVLISDSGKEIAFFGYDDNLKKTIARIKELETEKITAAYHRCEKFQDGLEKKSGWFWVGDN